MSSQIIQDNQSINGRACRSTAGMSLCLLVFFEDERKTIKISR
jgi:hypothetical protein